MFRETKSCYSVMILTTEQSYYKPETKLARLITHQVTDIINKITFPVIAEPKTIRRTSPVSQEERFQ